MSYLPCLTLALFIRFNGNNNLRKLWKTIGGRCLYQSPNGSRVFDNYLFRWLMFDSSALQTLIYRNAPHKAGLYYVNALCLAAQKKPGNACLLGLGGAGVAHALAPYLNAFTLTAIELNQEIIDIAAQFFMTNELRNLEIIHREANLFVTHCDRQFQHIMVDLFNANSFPEPCNNDDFFSHCRRILLPEGILAVNLANKREQLALFSKIKHSFNGITVIIPVKKCANMIVLASNSHNISSLLTLLKNCTQIKRLVWDRQWGCIAEY